jgi:hypothetical protein
VQRDASREPYIALAIVAKAGALLAKAPTVSKYLGYPFSLRINHTRYEYTHGL